MNRHATRGWGMDIGNQIMAGWCQFSKCDLLVASGGTYIHSR